MRRSRVRGGEGVDGITQRGRHEARGTYLVIKVPHADAVERHRFADERLVFGNTIDHNSEEVGIAA
jgi:hypothetical protein